MQSGDVTGTVRFRVVAGVVAVAGVVVAWVMGARLLAEPEEAGVPVVMATPSVVASEVEASPSEAASIEPSPSEVVSEEADVPVGQTVLFRGGPATGPWQQIGSVAEITHPDAPASARYFYDRFWSDPDEEGQSDVLWDELVARSQEAFLSIGSPFDGVAFGGAAGSEAFNSSGGVQDIYPDDEALTSYWMATVQDPDGDVLRAHYWFAIGFDGDLIDSEGPVTIDERDGLDFEQATARNIEDLRAWAADLGLARCAGC